jgi:TetR/AcrR family transcriptional regulator, cholesterol catabolism regulator
MSGEATEDRSDESSTDRRRRLLDAVLRVLASQGIAGVSMRAVAREAGVALGLVHYYFDDKTSLIAAALREIEEQDLRIVAPVPGPSAERRLRAALRRVADPEFLTTEYLALRMQLWALAQVNDEFAEINTAAQSRYREGLSNLIQAARPDLGSKECHRRAADIDVIQNGVWVTALLGLDKASIRRSVARTETVALARIGPEKESNTSQGNHRATPHRTAGCADHREPI